MIKSRRMRLTGHVVCMGRNACMQNIGGNARKERVLSEYLDVGGGQDRDQWMYLVITVRNLRVP
jgi:hypothetical protein